MASSLFALLDDIASLLDDVAAMTKVATKKTAGVLGDDLALNAEQVTGVDPTRELPVVWAVAKGSAINKVILVPSALVISAVAPWAITPLLMIGGAFLCFEGVEKILHKILHKKEAEEERAKIAIDLKRSIAYGLGHREETLDHATKFAKGLPRALVDKYVSLYVNELALDFAERVRGQRDEEHGAAPGKQVEPLPVERPGNCPGDPDAIRIGDVERVVLRPAER